MTNNETPDELSDQTRHVEIRAEEIVTMVLKELKEEGPINSMKIIMLMYQFLVGFISEFLEEIGKHEQKRT